MLKFGSFLDVELQESRESVDRLKSEIIELRSQNVALSTEIQDLKSFIAGFKELEQQAAVHVNIFADNTELDNQD